MRSKGKVNAGVAGIITLSLGVAMVARGDRAYAGVNGGRVFHVRQIPWVVDEAAWLQSAMDSLATNPGGTVAELPVLDMSDQFQGRFPNNSFPDPTLEDVFVVEARGNVVVGKGDLTWTFGVGSDDGFLLEIEGGHFVGSDETIAGDCAGSITAIDGNKLFYDGLRCFAESYGVFMFDRPGVYSVRLVFFENEGEAILEFFSARGDQLLELANASFCLVNAPNDPNALKLVGRR